MFYVINDSGQCSEIIIVADASIDANYMHIFDVKRINGKLEPVLSDSEVLHAISGREHVMATLHTRTKNTSRSQTERASCKERLNVNVGKHNTSEVGKDQSL